MIHSMETIWKRILPALLSLLLLAGCAAPAGTETEKGGSQAAADSASAVPAAEETASGAADSESPQDSVGNTADEVPADKSRLLPVVGLTTAGNYSETSVIFNSDERTLPGLDTASRSAYPALAEALDQFREQEAASSAEGFAERASIIQLILEDEAADPETYGSFYGREYAYIRRADSQVFSALLYLNSYSGGVHGASGYTALNLDAATGEDISLDSLLSDTGREKLNERVAAELDRCYPAEAPGFRVLEREPEEYTFTLDPDGVSFWFSPYEIAAYASGDFTVKLYFGRDGDLFTGQYDASDRFWCAEVKEELPFCYSPDGGVTARTAEVWAERGDDEYLEELCVEVDTPMENTRWEGRYDSAETGRTILRDDLYAYSVRLFDCHTPVGEYLLAVPSMDNDVQEVMVYSLDDAAALEPLSMTGPSVFWYPELPEDVEDVDDWSEFNMYRTVLTDPLELPLTVRMELFGTWEVEGPFCFGPDGVGLNGELLYPSREVTLTLLEDLAVQPVSRDNLFYTFEEEVTVPAGTEVHLFATDGADTAFFQVDEAVEGLPPAYADGSWAFGLSYDQPDSWPRLVNGIEEDDLFDGLLYAG